MAMNSSPMKGIAIVAVIVVIIAVAYAVLTMPDQRSTTDKIGDAVHELPNGVDKAGRQLEDRTPGQKLGDEIKDTGDQVKKDTAPQ